MYLFYDVQVSAKCVELHTYGSYSCINTHARKCAMSITCVFTVYRALLQVKTRQKFSAYSEKDRGPIEQLWKDN